MGVSVEYVNTKINYGAIDVIDTDDDLLNRKSAQCKCR